MYLRPLVQSMTVNTFRLQRCLTLYINCTVNTTEMTKIRICMDASYTACHCTVNTTEMTKIRICMDASYTACHCTVNTTEMTKIRICMGASYTPCHCM